jgi:putative spermidine/putrescine transport system permease protein
MPRLLRPLLILTLLLPFAPLVVWSFSGRWLFPALLPTEWGVRGWAYLLAPGTRVGEAFANSLLIALAVTAISVAIGLPAGRALGLHHFRGKTVIEFLVLAPTLVPVIAVAMGLHITFIRFGLADTLIGVVLVHLVPVLPYVTLTLSGIFANFNVDFEAQARTLGANEWRVWWHVTLPAIFPGVMAAALFAFIISWSQYLLTLLIGGGAVPTLPVLLLVFVNSGDYAVASALSLVFIAPAVVALLLTSRYLTGQHPALGGLGKL